MNRPLVEPIKNKNEGSEIMKAFLSQVLFCKYIFPAILCCSLLFDLHFLPISVVAGEHFPDEHTLMLLHFNGDLYSTEGEAPETEFGVVFEDGIFGAGAYLPVENQLLYNSLNNIDSTEGTLEFWIKPRWNGSDGEDHYALRFGLGGGMLFGKDAGNFWRCILNRWAWGGLPEVGTGIYVNEWIEDKWHHIAFTWDSHSLKIYVDGVLKTKPDIDIDLPVVEDTVFQVGADGSGGYVDAVIDELRISNIVRSENEIVSSFLAGITIYGLEISPNQINLLETWWKTPDLMAVTDYGTMTVPPGEAAWSISDSSIASVSQEGKIVAVSEGVGMLSASFNGFTAEAQVHVAAPVLEPEVETIDPCLATPAEGHLAEIPVVIIRYLPTIDGINLDESVTGYSSTLEDLKESIDTHTKRTKFMLEEGTRYHGYKNPNAVPSLGYRVVYIVTVYEEVQQGFPVPWNPGWYRPDYNQILTRFDAETFVNDLGVKEFWLVTWHYGGIEPAESNMSSPVTGDISNSERYEGDLPIYNHTYVVYGMNFTRTQSEHVHCHGHQLEAILSYINERQDGNTDLFWKNFVGKDDSGNFITGRCGWTHMPPNTTDHYDYVNPTIVESDIENWNPNGTGIRIPVNVDTWGNLVFSWPDGVTDFHTRIESQWYIYWMQNMPGHQSCIEYGENYMTNWWLFSADWDEAVATQGLYRSIPNCPPGFYKKIVCLSDNWYAKAEDGGDSNGDNISRSPTTDSLAKWELMADGDYHRIRLSGTEFYLSGEGPAGSIPNGRNIHLWTWADSDLQRWELIPDGSYFGLRCAEDDIYMSGSGSNNNIHLWQWAGSDLQRWDIQDYVFLEDCEGDFDSNGVVDESDLSVLAVDFGRANCIDSSDCPGDFNSDKDVDGKNLSTFMADFGRTDCP
jgi:hypothetical protein